MSKGIKRPFEDEREMARIKANQELKKRVKHMSPAERKAWYKTEKDNRASEERCLRRVFKDPVGYIDNVKSHRKEDAEVDHWWTCKDWCEREMNLKLAATYDEALQQQKTNKLIKIKRRGKGEVPSRVREAWCLGEDDAGCTMLG